MKSPPRGEASGASPLVSVDQFLHALVQCGLQAPNDLARLLAQLPAPRRHDVRALAGHLVRQERLTPYQANLLAQGKWRDLVMDKYLILDKIGSGGMGVVYKAEHRRMKRIVALKVLLPAITQSRAAVNRFQREVEAAAKLNHPNIVTAYDADSWEGTHFLVMEYVPGMDLGEMIKKRGPLSAAEAADYILQAARGLAHAHAQGMVHRDIKPSNLLVSPATDKQPATLVKILDMGLARFQELGAANSAEATVRPELTQAGCIVGTCEFMAPEQAMNNRLAGARSDIYSLGCTLYYLIEGKPMFGGETPLEKLLAHREAPIPQLGKSRRDVPAALQKIYLRMVAKDPDKRYQTMREVIADLEAHTNSHPATLSDLAGPTRPIPKVRPHRSGKRRLVLAAVGLFLAVAAVVAFLLLGRDKNNVSPPGASSARPDQSSPRVTNNKDVSSKSPVVKASPTQAAPQPREANPESLDAMPPARQAELVLKKLKERNPEFDGMGTHEVENGVVVALAFHTDHVEDLSPVRLLPHLRALDIRGTDAGKGRLRSLETLRGMSLSDLHVGYNPHIEDLGPLKGMQLTLLDCAGTQVADLTPLTGMPLTFLHCHDTKVRDLSPLSGAPLQQFRFDLQAGQDLSLLRTMPTLKKINGVSPADFWKKQSS